jgi:histidinol dehydrogenase
MLKIETNYNAFISKIHDQNLLVEDESIWPILSKIQREVKAQGNTALCRYTETFDGVNIPGDDVIVNSDEIDDAYTRVGQSFLDALRVAKKNIETFHHFQVQKDWSKRVSDGVEYGMRFLPIETAGIYVPGGRALYPSTVLMDTIPAKIAGVPRIVMTTPPQKTGKIADHILVAAKECGVDVIVKAGGAQSIFALAHGTESVPKVDKIVGPGNKYVLAAKQMVFGRVDIDKPAGPSEVCVYIDDISFASFAALECLAQLEHDPDAVAVVVSSNEGILKEVNIQFEALLEKCKRKEIILQSINNSALLLTKNSGDSINAINTAASEHLVLLSESAKEILPKIKNAGSIFCGPYTPVALGDYIAGPNHVLPTAGTARYASPLGVQDFVKFSSHLEYSKEELEKITPALSELALFEGLDAHALSAQLRL